MQAPTYAELQTFKKVASWLSAQAESLATIPEPLPTNNPRPWEMPKAGDNPFEVFDRFPEGAMHKTLIDASRAFRRLSYAVTKDCHSRAQRIGAWQKLGILAEPVGNKGIKLSML